MELKLEFIQIPDGEVIAASRLDVPASGLTLGRSASCGAHLPDRQRLVSASHARIYSEQAQWFIEDTSTNGVFINQNGQPLGRGNRFMLSDGDVVQCGGYRLLVNLFNMTQAPGAAWQGGLDGSAPEPEVDPFQPASSFDAPDLNDPFAEPSAAGLDIEPEDVELSGPAPETLAEVDEQGRTEPLIDVLDIPDERREPEFTPELTDDEPVTVAPLSKVTDVDLELLAPMNNQLPAAAQREHMTRQNQLIQQLVEDNQRLRQEIEHQQSHQEKLVYKCMGEALEQTLLDLSPTALEQLFDDYSERRWWRKRDNWRLYRRHFKRMMSEQTYKLTFIARFRKVLEKYQGDN